MSRQHDAPDSRTRHKDATPRPPRGPLALGLLAVGFAFGLLLFAALGVWQVQRMAWKQDLVARVDARIHADPAPAPDAAAWAASTPKEQEYRRVYLQGEWLPGQDTRVQAVTEAGAGRWLLRPLRRDGGGVVLVNLGYVPEDWTVSPPVPGPVEIIGLLRLSEPGGGFLRDNAPDEERWYSRDVAAIAAHHGLADVAPYFVDADVGSGARAGTPWPRGGLTVVRFRDNHLGYALTWFALALLVAGGAWRFALEEVRVRRRWRQSGPQEPMDDPDAGSAVPRRR
ncbi:SURF1 family protein [Pseudoxanthomonas suwonensis]|uniref:SURF1-like protein n=1 Tax=Pseudoxanthomonas suwonensis TaxID=314722 RepID=A0A0E3ULK0_9GAMM|nr:SURF1 family protein [Pseudoxanthomonas suwonensis]AKC85526.1 Surfeit locus 1 family protein [Pseudoxanthomonas suwonensis]